MLVLLIIYGYCELYSKDAIGLSLPKSETAKGNSEPTGVEFTIKADGGFYFKNQPIKLAMLKI